MWFNGGNWVTGISFFLEKKTQRNKQTNKQTKKTKHWGCLWKGNFSKIPFPISVALQIH